jgi:glycosyltransferase involved in cell wall biosynthesis
MGSRCSWAIALYERIIMRLVDQVFVVSEEDRRRLEEIGMSPTKGQLVPNGYDEERFYPDPAAGASTRCRLGIASEERVFLYFGHLGYAPNVEGLEVLHREIVPRLDQQNLPYHLVVAGRGATDRLRQQLSHPRVLFMGPVERIEDLIAAADVVAVPLLRGGGTRIKIIESIACGRPVVSTSPGAEGLDRPACGDRLFLADGWDAFASALTVAAASPPSGIAVPPAFRERYAWSAIGQRIHFDVC